MDWKFGIETDHNHTYIFCMTRGPFEKFVDWRQCAAVMQR